VFITLNVLPLVFVTYNLVPSGLTHIPLADIPTAIVAETVFVAVLITLIVLSPSFETYTLLPSEKELW